MTRLCSILCVALGFLAVEAGVAQDSPDSDAANDAKLVQPFVGDSTFLILKIDPKRIGIPESPKELDSSSPEVQAAFEKASTMLTAVVKQLRRLADDQPIFATVGIPISKTRVPVFCFRRKTSDESTESVTDFVKSQLSGDFHVYKDYIVATPRGAKPAPTYPAPDATQDRVAAAFKAVAGYSVQLLIVPPDHVWRTVNELSPELPRHLGGGPSSVLTEGIQWASIGLDPKRFHVEIVIQSASDEAARALAAHLPAMLRSVHKEAVPIHSQISGNLAKLLIGSLKPQVEGSQVKIRIDGFEKNSASLLLLTNIAQVVGAKRRGNTHQQRFRQILLGMHNYHSTNKMFPPTDRHRNKEGKHNLSWRVHILPYVEQVELYKQFQLDQPWDSPHNKKLIEKMPDIYARHSFGPSQDKLKPGLTTFLAPVGEKTIFGGAKATRLRQVTDGTSQTVVLLEVTPEKAVPWTAPADFSFNPQNPLAGVLIGVDGKWLCAFADGSVHQLRADISRKSALYLFQMSDGKVINFDQIR